MKNKKLLLVLLSVFFLYLTVTFSVLAQNNVPVVSNVRFMQRTGTKLIDITYDVYDADGDLLTITVAVSADGGQTFTIIPVTIAGDVGTGILSGTGKSIVWDAGVDYPGHYGTNYVIKIIADDGVYPYGEMVPVPAGEFQMGDNFNEGSTNERPVHSVYLDAYYIGKYEVTNEEYIEYLRDAWSKGNITISGNDVKGLDGNYYYLLNYSYKTINYGTGNFTINETYNNHPVVVVSWYGAVFYCNWRSEKEGLEKCYDSNYNVDITKNGYRLPTEAEWEKAARGTDQRRYPWGNNIDGSYANYWESGDPFEYTPYPYSTPVGYYDGSNRTGYQTNYNASPYGAYDMAGNVWEWCHDWYDSGYYSNSPYRNPIMNIIGSYRVIRGGSWDYNADSSLRGANRVSFNPNNRYFRMGFRCVRGH